jgi:hypothetical protein
VENASAGDKELPLGFGSLFSFLVCGTHGYLSGTQIPVSARAFDVDRDGLLFLCAVSAAISDGTF